jgi:hypothetical protein
LPFAQHPFRWWDQRAIDASNVRGNAIEVPGQAK